MQHIYLSNKGKPLFAEDVAVIRQEIPFVRIKRRQRCHFRSSPSSAGSPCRLIRGCCLNSNRTGYWLQNVNKVFLQVVCEVAVNVSKNPRSLRSERVYIFSIFEHKTSSNFKVYVKIVCYFTGMDTKHTETIIYQGQSFAVSCYY